MCLNISPQQRFKRAKEDIVVYKTLIAFFSWYETTFRRQVIPEIPYTVKANFKRIKEDMDSTTVGYGIHSYAYREEAFLMRGNAEIVAKCIIPKGAYYIVGNFNEMSSYVSTKLIYQKKL